MRLFANLRAYVFDPSSRGYRRVNRFLVDGPAFASFEHGEIGGGHEVVDLRGATVVPAFADCHVHLTDTGYLLGLRDLGAVRSAAEFADSVAALPEGDRVLLAGNYDESTWRDGSLATASPLERAHPERLAMLVRIDGHSCLVNRKTFAWLDLGRALPGIERDDAGVPTGRLFLEANRRAQASILAEIPEAQRRDAERCAAQFALSEGALHLHVQLVGFANRDAYATEIEAMRAIRELKWHPKICERDPALAKSFGLPYVGGDVFLDGSIGSGTAAMTHPYADRAGSGVLTFDDATVEAYFAEAEALGVSAGVHAIGDAAIEQCIAAWERVLGGKASLRSRHFIEHFEVATPDQIARCAGLGIYLSMQPQFDALWGGAGGMYEQRLGSDRMRGMNALRTALRSGAVLCGGDDSPVCRLSPLAGMAAACEHHNRDERLSPLEALTMYAYDAARFGHAETHTGALLAGFDADFTVLDNDPFADGSFAKTRVLQTWKDGTCVYDRDEPATGVFSRVRKKAASDPWSGELFRVS